MIANETFVPEEGEAVDESGRCNAKDDGDPDEILRLLFGYEAANVGLQEHSRYQIHESKQKGEENYSKRHENNFAFLCRIR